MMTVPASGSEMNKNAVISSSETNEKRLFLSQYPEFSILDPESTFSLPAGNIANGLADMYVHVIEQYLTTPGQSRIMDRWAEGLLLSILEIAPWSERISVIMIRWPISCLRPLWPSMAS